MSETEERERERKRERERERKRKGKIESQFKAFYFAIYISGLYCQSIAMNDKSIHDYYADFKR